METILEMSKGMIMYQFKRIKHSLNGQVVVVFVNWVIIDNLLLSVVGEFYTWDLSVFVGGLLRVLIYVTFV